jgi:hypothetical protein
MRKSEAEHRGDALRQLQELGRVSVPNAAVLMEIHPYTLREYIQKGFVEAFWIGKRPWIMGDEIERYRTHGKRTPEHSHDITPTTFDLSQ